jgi:hypothetical protein
MTIRRHLLVFGLLAGALALGGGVWLFWPDDEFADLGCMRPHTRMEKVRGWLGL